MQQHVLCALVRFVGDDRLIEASYPGYARVPVTLSYPDGSSESHPVALCFPDAKRGFVCASGIAVLSGESVLCYVLSTEPKCIPVVDEPVSPVAFNQRFARLRATDFRLEQSVHPSTQCSVCVCARCLSPLAGGPHGRLVQSPVVFKDSVRIRTSPGGPEVEIVAGPPLAAQQTQHVKAGLTSSTASLLRAIARMFSRRG